jgi:hypothetical protein
MYDVGLLWGPDLQVVGTASCGVREAREQMKTNPFVGCLSAAKRRGAERHRRTLVGVHRFDQMARGQTFPPPGYQGHAGSTRQEPAARRRAAQL